MLKWQVLFFHEITRPLFNTHWGKWCLPGKELMQTLRLSSGPPVQAYPAHLQGWLCV